jgi:hypothetical protein
LGKYFGREPRYSQKEAEAQAQQAIDAAVSRGRPPDTEFSALAGRMAEVNQELATRPRIDLPPPPPRRAERRPERPILRPQPQLEPEPMPQAEPAPAPVAKRAPTKRPVAKTAAVKKTVVKKTAVKKSAVKKAPATTRAPAAKRPAAKKRST